MLKKTVIALFAGCVMQLYADGAPKEILEAAHNDLALFLQTSANGHFPELLGIPQNSNLSDITLGEPLQLYSITAQALLDYTDGTPVERILTETSRWYFPLIYNSTITSLLIVDQLNGRWEKVSVGHLPLAQEISAFFKQWPYEKGYTPKLVTQFQLQVFLFTIPQQGAFNLTPLTGNTAHTQKSTALKQSFANRYTTLHTLTHSIESLKMRSNEIGLNRVKE